MNRVLSIVAAEFLHLELLGRLLFVASRRVVSPLAFGALQSDDFAYRCHFRSTPFFLPRNREISSLPAPLLCSSLEPSTRFELVTPSLPRTCSTPELRGRPECRMFEWRETRTSNLPFISAFDTQHSTFLLERETGFEPATNGLEGRDSTTELLPLVRPLVLCLSPFTQPLVPPGDPRLANVKTQRPSGGERRIRTSEGMMPADLQSAAFDHSAISPLARLELATGLEPATC